MPSPQTAVSDRIGESLEAGASVYVSDLMERARSAGASRSEAWNVVASACAEPAIQRSWTDWEQVSEQGEIHLRLRVLAEQEFVAPEVEDFLTFFFRASAPELYQPAALALGGQSWEHLAIEQHLRDYAATHGVDFGGKLTLENERSRRRLLLAFTERYIRAPEKDSAPEFPLAPGIEASLAQASAADATVIGVSLERLIASGVRQNGEALKLAWQLLEGLHGHLEHEGSQRRLVRVWGALLGAAAQHDRERAASIWADCLLEFESRRASGFSTRLASLWEFDTVISAAIEQELDLGPEDGFEMICERLESSDARGFARMRHRRWIARYGATDVVTPCGDNAADEVSDPALKRFIQQVCHSSGGGANNRDATHRWMAQALESLESPKNWWAHPARSRALLAFLCLDIVRYRELAESTILQLFASVGVSQSVQNTSSSPAPGIEGMAWKGVHDLLWYIFVREGSPAAFPVESESLTSISNAERLLGFLRVDQSMRDADILVDALEHFVRLELASEPSFEFRHFLYRVAARKPPPSIFREFAKRTKERTYQTSNGEPIDLHGALKALEMEATEQPDAVLETKSQTEWFPELEDVRESLREVADRHDLADALEHFADHLDPRIPDPATHRRGIVDLVGQIVPDDGTVLLDSRASGTSSGFETIAGRVAESVRGLREATVVLFQDPGAGISEMHRSAQNANRELKRIEQSLVPVLAELDCLLVVSIVADLRERLTEWTAILEQRIEIPLDNADVDPTEVFDCVFEDVDHGETLLSCRANQSRLFRIAYRASAKIGAGDTGEEVGVESIPTEEEWHFRKRLLVSAESARQRATFDDSAVTEFLADRWSSLAEIAMSAQAEPCVIELVTRPEFAQLRREAGDSVTVEKLEDWLLDRYSIQPLASLLSDCDSGGGKGLSPTTRAVFRFMANFGHVWLALLVGAVMLLDFGDPWIEMARAGDVSGIAITFAIGIGGTLSYLFVDIARKTDSLFGTASWRSRMSRVGRVVSFLAVCFLYVLGVTSGLWYLFSGTDVVLHGPAAILHILVWTGFALFVGVFFGLLTDAI